MRAIWVVRVQLYILITGLVSQIYTYDKIMWNYTQTFTHITFLVLMLYYNFVRWIHWGKLLADEKMLDLYWWLMVRKSFIIQARIGLNTYIYIIYIIYIIYVFWKRIVWERENKSFILPLKSWFFSEISVTYKFSWVSSYSGINYTFWFLRFLPCFYYHKLDEFQNRMDIIYQMKKISSKKFEDIRDFHIV